VLPADRLYDQDVSFDEDDSDVNGASGASDNTDGSDDDESSGCNSKELSFDPAHTEEPADSSVLDDKVFTGGSDDSEDIQFVSLGNISEVCTLRGHVIATGR
jgi:hypothetical protein